MNERKAVTPTLVPDMPEDLHLSVVSHKIPGYEWDRESLRWRKGYKSTTGKAGVEPAFDWEAAERRERLPLFPEMKESPGTFLKMHADLLAAEGYRKQLVRKNDERYEEAIRERMKSYLRQETSWLEFEDAVLDWYLFNLSQLERAKKKPMAAPQKQKEVLPMPDTSALKLSNTLRAALDAALRHFPDATVLSHGHR